MVTTTTATNPTRAGRHTVDHDDYALVRVPQQARVSCWAIAVQRLGQLSTLGQLSLAVMIGMGMSLASALLAIAIGCVLLEVVALALGLAGMREGLSTSLLARWSGFGTRGSLLVGLALMVSLTGWFAVQTEVFAAGLQQFLPGVELPTLCLIAGLVVTLIAVRGFAVMTRVAAVAVPLSLLLVVVTVVRELQGYDLARVLAEGPAGTPISLSAGVSMVVGGFIVGAVMTPDMARYHRNARDVLTQTVVSITLGHALIGVLGVLLAHALRVRLVNQVPEAVGVVQSGFGLIGVTLLAASILPVNGWNLYPSSLAAVNAAHVLRGTRLRRAMTALVFGVVGSGLAALGWSAAYEAFLVELGALFPPVAAIMIADYFVLQTWRAELHESGAHGLLPGYAPAWVYGGLLAWLAGYVVASPHLLGRWVDLGVPPVTSFVVAFGGYLALSRFGLAGKGPDDLERRRG